jgi:Kdo2-lipid IVA lauroyltransferase/acyltransferase
MARSKSSITIQVEYNFFRGLLRILRILPISLSRQVSLALLNVILFFIPKRRRLIQKQLEDSFPNLTPAQCREFAKQSVYNLARLMAIYPRIASMTDAEMEKTVEIEGFEHIREAFRKGKGMITFTAHYGCWELMAIYVTRLYPKIAMVVRPLDNPLLDAMVSAVRGSGGGGVIDSRRVFKDGLRLLRDNGILGVLIDQNFYKGGVFVVFFGRPAATNTLVPILARRTGCAVLPMHNVWKGNKIRIICEAPVTLSANPDSQAAIVEDTQKLTSIVEGWVRRDPGQWMWLHHRWKRAPESAS